MAFQNLKLLPSRRFFSVDIGTHRIKVLLCETSSDGLKILSSGSARQARSAMMDGEISDLRSVAATLSLALDRASTAAWVPPAQDAIVSLPSSSVATDALSMNYVREDPTEPIDMAEIDDMVARTERLALSRMSERLEWELGIVATEARLAATILTSVVIDAKKVHNPLGFTGGEIRYRLLNAFAPRSDLSAVRSIFSQLGLKIISIVPPVMSLPKLAEHGENIAGHLILDIGECHTLLALMVDGEFRLARALPIGMRLFDGRMRRVRPTSSYLDTEGMLHESDTLDAEAKKVLSDTIHFIVKSSISLMGDGAFTSLDRVTLSGACSASETIRKEVSNSLGQLALRREPEVMQVHFDSDIPLSPADSVAYALSHIAHETFSLFSGHPLSTTLRSLVYRFD